MDTGDRPSVSRARGGDDLAQPLAGGAPLKLARFLGAAEDRVIGHTYADAVMPAGHSCPTVASAYLMSRAALRKNTTEIRAAGAMR